MITRAGSSMAVHCYQSEDHRNRNEVWATERATSVSAGPPGVIGDWGRTESGRWVLIFKPKHHPENEWEGIYK